MSIITDSGFWDSVNGDRRYSGRQILGVFNGLVSDGIVKGYKNSMQVRINSNKLQIRPGRAFLSYGSYEGIWADIDTETEITVSSADSYLGRCDAVVLTLRGGSREVTVDYVTGIPSSNYLAYDGWPSSIAGNQFIIALVLRNPGTGTTINTTTTRIEDARGKTLRGEGTAADGITGISYAAFAGMSSSTYVERQQDTASRVMITDSSGLVRTSGVTTTELSGLSGLTDNVQTQINRLHDGLPAIVMTSADAASINLDAENHAGRTITSASVNRIFNIRIASTAGWAQGTEILIIRASDNTVTIKPETTGVTIRGIDVDSPTTQSWQITDKYGVACLKYITGNTWYIFGNIEPL